MTDHPPLVSDADKAVRTTILQTLPGLMAEKAPTITADQVMAQWHLSTVPQQTQHPITSEAQLSIGVLFNLWVGPGPTGQVVAATPVLPQVYAMTDPEVLHHFLSEAVTSLERSYLTVRSEFTGSPLPESNGIPILGEG